MTARSRPPVRLQTRTILLPGGAEREAPYDPRCGACRSPWVVQIDQGLMDGLTPAAIKHDLANRKPSCPTIDIIQGHVAHLADPQRQLRQLLDDTERSAVGVIEALTLVINSGFQAAAEGLMPVSSSDWLKALALMAKIQVQQERHASAEAYQAAFMAFFEICKRYMKPAEWSAFSAECYSSPEILAVSNRMLPGGPGG